MIEKGDNSDNNSKITSVKNRQQSRHAKKAHAPIKPSQEQATSKPPKVEDTQKSAQEKTAMKSFSGLDIVTEHSQARKNHLAWLRGGYLDMLKTSGKSIPVFNASELNQERFQQLSKVVENELVKINKTGVNDFVSRMGGYVIYTPPKDFLKDPSEHAAKKLSSEIVTKILSDLDIILKSKQNKPSESDPSEVDTLHLRTLEIRRPDLFKGVKKFIEKSDEIKPKHLEHGDANDLAEQLSYVLLKELERGEEICYYHSGEDTGAITFAGSISFPSQRMDRYPTQRTNQIISDNSKTSSVENHQPTIHAKNAHASIKSTQKLAPSKFPQVEDTQKSAQEKTAMKSFSGLI